MLDVQRRLHEQGVLPTGHAIAALLNSAPSWPTHYSLDEQDRGNIMENMVSAAIEGLLAPGCIQETVSLNPSLEKNF